MILYLKRCQDEDVISQKLKKLFVTIYKIERLFMKKPMNFQIGRGGSTSAKDLVIRASPQNPPHILPILCAQLQQSMNVFTATHLHSSVTKNLPNTLEDYLPNPNCESRTKADICMTLIWKDGKTIRFKI